MKNTIIPKIPVPIITAFSQIERFFWVIFGNLLNSITDFNWTGLQSLSHTCGVTAPFTQGSLYDFVIPLLFPKVNKNLSKNDKFLKYAKTFRKKGQASLLNFIFRFLVCRRKGFGFGKGKFLRNVLVESLGKIW